MQTLPAPLSDGSVFVYSGTRERAMLPQPAEPRWRSALHGRPLSSSAAKLAAQQAKLPTAAEWKKIMSNMEKFGVTILRGETGSGKSTQAPQMALDFVRRS
jgi:HrpA-like RNA helicase